MVGKWEIVEMQPHSQVIILLKQEDFCGAIALTCFVENCSDLPPQYLRNEDISKVFVNLLPKITQFTCDKKFTFFVQMDLYPRKTYKHLVLFTSEIPILKTQKA